MTRKPTGRTVGRPAKSDSEKILPNGLHPRQFEDLATEGAHRGLSASQVLREAVDFYIAYRDTLLSTEAGVDDLVDLGMSVFSYVQQGNALFSQALFLGRHPDCADLAADDGHALASLVGYKNELTNKCRDCGHPIPPNYERCVSCAWELEHSTVR